MDRYTKKTRIWLDKRYARCNKQGIYFAHGPIYGFQKGYTEGGIFRTYVRTYQLMDALSHLKFNSLLDAGGAEAYKAHVSRECFHVETRNCDLSGEACKRAEQIFGIRSDPADLHALPYKDGQFDVVLSSETLEHVTDFRRALSEILRVARKAVVITVPYESKETIEKNVLGKVPHGHIHNFTPSSFDYLRARGYLVFSKGIVSQFLAPLGALIERREPKSLRRRNRTVLREIQRAFFLVSKRLVRKKVVSFLVRFDDFVCRILPRYHSILFVILKDKDALQNRKAKKISTYQIMNIEVPYHYLKR